MKISNQLRETKFDFDPVLDSFCSYLCVLPWHCPCPVCLICIIPSAHLRTYFSNMLFSTTCRHFMASLCLVTNICWRFFVVFAIARALCVCATAHRYGRHRFPSVYPVRASCVCYLFTTQTYLRSKKTKKCADKQNARYHRRMSCDSLCCV